MMYRNLSSDSCRRSRMTPRSRRTASVSRSSGTASVSSSGTPRPGIARELHDTSMVGTRRDRPLTVVGAGRSRSVLAPPQPALEAGRARDFPRTRTTPSSGWTSFQLVPFVSRRPAPRTPRSADPQEAEERDDGAVTGAFACDVRPTIECLAVGVTEALRGVRRLLAFAGFVSENSSATEKGRNARTDAQEAVAVPHPGSSSRARCSE